MAINVVDLVKIKALSTGTGAISLGDAVAGYRGVEALINGLEYSYSIQQGADFEIGKGTYLSGGNLLVRSPRQSSNGGAALDLEPNAAVSFVLLSSDLAQIKQGPPGEPGAAGPAGNVAATLADLKAAPITNVTMLYDQSTFTWTEGDYSATDPGQLDLNVVASDNALLTEGAWIRQPASKIALSSGNSLQYFVDLLLSEAGAGAILAANGDSVEANLGRGGSFTAPGMGGLTRDTATRLLESVLHATDYGAPADGSASARAGLLAATAQARKPAFADGIGRVFSERVHLPVGKYTLDDIASLANATGTVGLVVSGDGGTEIDFVGSTATIQVLGSRRILFKDLVFKSSGVDDNQVGFTIANSTGDGSSPLVGWQFWNCEFQQFYKCFDVSGNQMCSEFVFFGCKFSQCYRLKNNSNVQAVNWSFYGCDWDNSSLTTTKDKTLSAIFYLAAGNKVNWYGGSIINYGRWVLYDLKSAGLVQRVAHSVHFIGPRVELVDEGGSHVPIIDRIDSGYINGTNQPVVTIEDIEDIKLGTIGISTDIVIARVWANCSLTIRDCHAQTCHVTGVIDSQTATAGAQVVIENCSGIGYQEDTTARVSDHDQHNVRIRPSNVSAGTAIDIDQRGCSLSIPVSMPVKRLRLRGPTGSIPQGGTTINLPTFPPHTEIINIGFERFGSAAQSITGDLRDQADTSSYGAVTVASGVNTGAAKINKEVGSQIPAGTALMAKFTGTPEVVKGFFYIDYQ